MRQFIVLAICSMFLACSSNNTCTKTPEPQPKPAPTVTVPVPAPVPEPQPEIFWQPFDSVTKTLLQDTGYCALFYFSTKSPLCEGCKVVEVTLQNPEVVELVNDAFIAIRFPVEQCMLDVKCAAFLTNELGVTELPTTVLAFAGDDSISLVGEGAMSVEQYKEFLSKKQEQYDECKSLKEGTND
jgi:hypothetical protein